MPISFLYFDFGNVLSVFSHDRMCRQMAEVAGVSAELVEKVLFDGDFQHRFEEGEFDTATYFERFCDAVGTRPDRGRLELAASDIFAVNESIVPLIEGLAKAGNRLGVLSNTNECHWRHIYDGRFAPLLPGPFEEIVLSYEEHLMKPDAAIYQVASERAGIPIDHVFFTDDRTENVAGGQAAGMDAVLFENAAQLADELRRRGVPGA